MTLAMGSSHRPRSGAHGSERGLVCRWRGAGTPQQGPPGRPGPGHHSQCRDRQCKEGVWQSLACSWHGHRKLTEPAACLSGRNSEEVAVFLGWGARSPRTSSALPALPGAALKLQLQGDHVSLPAVAGTSHVPPGHLQLIGWIARARPWSWSWKPVRTSAPGKPVLFLIPDVPPWGLALSGQRLGDSTSSRALRFPA